MAEALMFRYLEQPNKLQVFRIELDGPEQAFCRGTVHEFAVNANECTDGKYKLKDVGELLPGAMLIDVDLWNAIEHVQYPWDIREFPSAAPNDPNTVESKPFIPIAIPPISSEERIRQIRKNPSEVRSKS